MRREPISKPHILLQSRVFGCGAQRLTLAVSPDTARVPPGRLARRREISQRKRVLRWVQGFTALEITIVVGILTILGALSLVSFLNARRAESLVTAGNDALAVLRMAQERSLAGEEEDTWGVHFASGQYHLFRGPGYAMGAVVQTYAVPSGIEIADITLADGGSEAVFRRLDGRTAQSGTLTVRVQGSLVQTFRIVIDPSGRAYQAGTALAPAGGRIVDTRHRTFTFSWGIDNATELRFSFSDPVDVRTVVMAPAAPRTSYDSGDLTFSVDGSDQVMRVHALSLSPTQTALSIDHDCRKNNKKVVIAIRDADAAFRDIAAYEADCHTVAVGAFGGVMTEP